jgi:hypothetical protein
MTIKPLDLRAVEAEVEKYPRIESSRFVPPLIAALRETRAALTLALGALTNVSHTPGRPTIFDDGTCPPCHAAKRAAAVLARVRDERPTISKMHGIKCG